MKKMSLFLPLFTILASCSNKTSMPATNVMAEFKTTGRLKMLDPNQHDQKKCISFRDNYYKVEKTVITDGTVAPSIKLTDRTADPVKLVTTPIPGGVRVEKNEFSWTADGSPYLNTEGTLTTLGICSTVDSEGKVPGIIIDEFENKHLVRKYKFYIEDNTLKTYRSINNQTEQPLIEEIDTWEHE